MATVADRPVVDGFEAAGSPFYEVVDGRLTQGKTLGAEEIWLASLIDDVLDEHAKRHELGRVIVEMIFLLDESRNLQRRPDVAFVSFERWPARVAVPRRSAWDVIPDLAVEVGSDSNTASEIPGKIEDYFRAGVRLVWVVYPLQRVFQSWTSPGGCTVTRPGGSVDGGEVMPGLKLEVAGLFPPVDKA